MSSPTIIVDVLAWACAVFFISTALITILALVGVLTLGGRDGKQHDFYLKRLFATLMIQVIAVSVGAFAAYIHSAQEQVNGIAVSSKGNK